MLALRVWMHRSDSPTLDGEYGKANRGLHPCCRMNSWVKPEVKLEPLSEQITAGKPVMAKVSNKASQTWRDDIPGSACANGKRVHESTRINPWLYFGLGDTVSGSIGP